MIKDRTPTEAEIDDELMGFIPHSGYRSMADIQSDFNQNAGMRFEVLTSDSMFGRFDRLENEGRIRRRPGKNVLSHDRYYTACVVRSTNDKPVVETPIYFVDIEEHDRRSCREAARQLPRVSFKPFWDVFYDVNRNLEPGILPTVKHHLIGVLIRLVDAGYAQIMFNDTSVMGWDQGSYRLTDKTTAQDLGQTEK